MGPGPHTTATSTASTATPPPPPPENPLPDLQYPLIKEEQHSTAGEEPKKDESAHPTGDPGHRCVQNLCRAVHAFRASSLYVSPAPSSRVQSVLHVPRTVPHMSLVTAYIFGAFCTAAKPDYADESVWDADKDNNSDVDVYTQFSEGDGEGWPDPDEARRRQLFQPLFFHEHTYTAPSPSQHALTQQTPQSWRR